MLKLVKGTSGYFIWKPGAAEPVQYVHTTVATAFLGARPDSTEVRQLSLLGTA